MIFAIHSDSLLDSNLFRRDQVWVAQKDEGGASELYSFWDVRARKGEDLRKNYRSGRYGGVPYLPDLEEKDILPED